MQCNVVLQARLLLILLLYIIYSVLSLFLLSPRRQALILIYKLDLGYRSHSTTSVIALIRPHLYPCCATSTSVNSVLR